MSPTVRKWICLIAASLGLFLSSLDLAVNVALPAMTADLHANMSSIQWVIIVYLGTMTGLQLIVGRLADAHGLKRFYLTGILTYTSAVTAISFTQALELILVFRVVQALGYALMLTTGPALVTRLFDHHERGQGLGLMTSVGTLGMITATLGGGYLVAAFGWEAVFLARLPVGIIAFALAYLMLQEHKAEAPPHVDVLGAVTLFLGIAAIILFMNLGGRFGWADPWVLASVCLGLASFCAFVLIERREPSPIVRLDVISLEVARALLAAFMMSMFTFINLFILPFFVADIIGADAETLGILLMLPPIVSAVSAPLAGWLSDRHPPRWVATLALGWLAVATGSFAFLNESSSVVDVGWRMALFGVGLGSFQASNTSSIMGSMPADALSTGAAMMSLCLGLGMVTSVGLMTLLFEYFEAAALLTLTPDIAFVAAFEQTYLVAAGALLAATLLSMPLPIRFRKRAASLSSR